MNKLSDQQIIFSWKKNARPWISAVEKGEIESRRLVTNQAVVQAVLQCSPQSVLDFGCGEGWLTRELVKVGVDVLGVDVVSELVEHAKAAGDGRFRCLSYEECSYQSIGEKFDVILCNFSLFGYESVNHLFQLAPYLLNEGGSLIIQTIHPVAGCGDEAYEDGWREGSWAGFNGEFVEPASWYFRTMESWKLLYLNSGLQLGTVIEPINQKTNRPASVIFSGMLV